MTPRTSPGPVRNGTQFHLNNTAGLGQKSLDNALKEGRITPDDARLIQTYIRERSQNGQLKFSTKNKIAFYCLLWRKEAPPFNELTTDDVYSTLEKFTGANGDPTKYAQNTLHTLFGVVRPFLLWLIEEGHNSVLNEKKIRKIKRPSANTMTKKAADILTDDEIKQIIQACVTSRDRALIQMLYEGGFRIGELGNLTWGDIKFDTGKHGEKLGVIVNTNQKTGKPRYVRLTMSREYLAAWKADYPFAPEPESLVFITTHRKTKEPVTYDGIRRQIQYIVERAGIKRKITPHLFRHSRITHLIQAGVPESVIKLSMWGSVDTDMFKTYAHLVSTDIDKAMFDLNGIKQPEEKKKDRLEARQCPVCFTVCGPLTNFCPECGSMLTEEAKETTLDYTQQVIDDPALKAALMNISQETLVDMILKLKNK